jgi:hypothetical protein
MFQIRSRQLWSSGVRGGNVRPVDVSLSGRPSTSGGIESVACFVSIGRMVTEYSVPRVTSATEPWRVKAIARQHSGTAERPGSDLPFGAGQQSWLTHGREKQTSHRPETSINNTPSKMYVRYLKINPQPPFYSDNDLRARRIPTAALPVTLAFYCRSGAKRQQFLVT